jgi:F420-dependent oxidoreductase-like protein
MTRVGLQLPSFSWPGGPPVMAPRLVEIAQAAEAAGFSSLWVMDHFFQLPEATGWGGPQEPMLESYTTLGFLAGATERIRLGPMVAGVHFRPPGVLLKAASTLDVLSGGRSYFALGAGWYEREARGLGLAFPERRVRFELLEDVLRLAHHVWSDAAVEPYEGHHVSLREPIFEPQPLQRPRPAIMVGGGGERRTLRLVAQYADACNILVPDPGESRAKLAVLARHCEELGRDYGAIEKTALVETDLRPGRGSARDVVTAIRAQADEGIEHVIVNMPDAHVIERLETFGREIIPEVAGRGAVAA